MSLEKSRSCDTSLVLTGRDPPHLTGEEPRLTVAVTMDTDIPPFYSTYQSVWCFDTRGLIQSPQEKLSPFHTLGNGGLGQSQSFLKGA